MLFKTHLAINLFFALFFANYTADKIVFLALVLFATLIPDIDSLSSYIGRRARPLSTIITFFSKHREFFHSFTCVFILSILLLLFLPQTALPVFIGYAMHLFADSFTKEGIQVFWPVEKRVKWRIKTGGLVEKIIFFAFALVDIVYLVYIF